jgi:hypothetical protein
VGFVAEQIGRLLADWRKARGGGAVRCRRAREDEPVEVGEVVASSLGQLRALLAAVDGGEVECGALGRAHLEGAVAALESVLATSGVRERDV